MEATKLDIDKPETDDGSAKEGGLTGTGTAKLSAPPETVWRQLLNPQVLRQMLPACDEIEHPAPDRYRASMNISVAGIRSVYQGDLKLEDMHEPEAVRMIVKAQGALGFGSGEAWITLAPSGKNGTLLSYRYRADIGGKVASVGRRMIGMVMRVVIKQFFSKLNKHLTGGDGRRV